jgi:arginyl-tRNA synthetase
MNPMQDLCSDLAACARATLVAQCAADVTDIPLAIPEDRSKGDVVINAFQLAKVVRQAPPKLAEILATGLATHPAVESVEAVKGYVNLKLKPSAVLTAATEAVLADPLHFGDSQELAGQRLMVEYSAPNTNKPLHLGHMRNNFLGHSLAAILTASGANVIRANLFNDRGIHICKSMLAWKRFMNGATPESLGVKGDHLVGDCYVRFEREFAKEVETFCAANAAEFEGWRAKRIKSSQDNKSEEAELKEWKSSFREEGFTRIPLGLECAEMLRAWEKGDAEVLALWSMMNGWAFAGFAQTYAEQGVAFDLVYRESETWTLGRDVVLAGLESGVFSRRADGAVEIDLSAEKLGSKVVLRSDGTSVYITQDIGTTILKAKQHQLQGQIWVVGDEQERHFEVLFAILKRLGHPWAANLHHLAYGLVNLPEGRMKSREGTVVDADDLLAETARLAAEEVKARDVENRIPADEVTRRATAVALAALRFMLLKVTPKASMTFDPRESVKFDGDTGARVLYAAARLNSLQDGQPVARASAAQALPGDQAEVQLALTILTFPVVRARAAREYNPGLIAKWLLDLVRDLNRFYDRCPVLKAEQAEWREGRLALCAAAQGALARGAGLLGLPLLARM